MGNVLGDSLPEKFYVINRDTAYVEIDGVNLSDYIKRTRAEGGKR